MIRDRERREYALMLAPFLLEAGFVPSGLEEMIDRKPLAGKNIFVAHGTGDQMVPIDRAHASMGLLERAGAQITYCEDEVGHKLSVNCLRALEAYLKD